MSKLMITNGTEYDMSDILEYLAGYTTKLNDKIQLHRESGVYYNTVVVNYKNQI